MHKSSQQSLTEQADGTRPWRKHRWRKTSYFVTLALVLMVIAGVVIGGWHVANSHAASSSTCTPNAILVNPCRPWFGAAAGRNPGAPSNSLAQAEYLNKLVGQNLDIFRFYHAPSGSNGLGDLPLDPKTEAGKTEISLLENSIASYIDVNWKPASTWAEAGGGNASINAEIKQVAGYIKAVAPHKIFLTVWHEPQQAVSAFDNSTEQTACQSDPHFKGLKGSAGTPDQYQAMWHNVENIFKQQGVTNVVWAMNYMSDPSFDCLIPYLWPGNQSVDWVLYDTYARRDNPTYAETAGAFYKVLQKDSSPNVDFDAKPWGLGEFNDCNPATPQEAITYFNDVRTAFQANTYPRLKMYLVFADIGPQGRQGCLTDYNNQGQLWPAKQTAFNQLAKAVLNK